MALQTEKDHFQITYAFHSRYRCRLKLLWIFFVADADAAVLCSLKGPHSRKMCFGNSFISLQIQIQRNIIIELFPLWVRTNGKAPNCRSQRVQFADSIRKLHCQGMFNSDRANWIHKSHFQFTKVSPSLLCSESYSFARGFVANSDRSDLNSESEWKTSLVPLLGVNWWKSFLSATLWCPPPRCGAPPPVDFCSSGDSIINSRSFRFGWIEKKASIIWHLTFVRSTCPKIIYPKCFWAGGCESDLQNPPQIKRHDPLTKF